MRVLAVTVAAVVAFVFPVVVAEAARGDVSIGKRCWRSAGGVKHCAY